MKRKSVLVIDDDPDIRELLRVLLENAGFKVDTLGDGIAALKLRKRYEAILLDLNMPVFDGEQLTSYWVMSDPELLRRVIVLSAYSAYTRGRTLPATFGFVMKPIQHNELLRLVEECVNQ
jgi:CheY-like chemotaxis protein